MSSMTKSKIRAARVIVVCATATIVTVGSSMVALAGMSIN
jgi:hypothetical protein